MSFVLPAKPIEEPRDLAIERRNVVSFAAGHELTGLVGHVECPLTGHVPSVLTALPLVCALG
jgi:hypothetical protein